MNTTLKDVPDPMITQSAEDQLHSSFDALVDAIGLTDRGLLSINDLTAEQIYRLFELADLLKPWRRSGLELLPTKVMATLFFQPSTRTRLSFETAMLRLGGKVISETTPLVSSSAAKEESLGDMVTTVSKYANVIVLRHPNATEAREAVGHSDAPVINAGFGDWEHPTQALLDLYTIWRTHGTVEGVKVCVASPDLVAARTGHSMAQGLARLGANVVLASLERNRTPSEVMEKLRDSSGQVKEVFDLNQSEFNDVIADVDLVYLPGCSAPKGEEAEAFKQLMDDYFVRYETLERVQREQGRTVYVTHTLPRRAGEMDPRIDGTPNQQYFEAVSYSVAVRMALLVSILRG